MRILDASHVVDITQPISPGGPVWPGDPHTSLQPWTDLDESGFRLHEIRIGEHSGTHVGAPSHYVRGGETVDRLSGGSLIGEVAVVDARTLSAGNVVPMAVLDRHEDLFGAIGDVRFILFYTGWSDCWGTDRYYGSVGQPAPVLDRDLAEALVAMDGLIGIGIDGPDVGAPTSGGAGQLLAEHGIVHIENLTHLDALAPAGYLLFVGALPIIGGTGSPCRVLAVRFSLLSDDEA